MGDTHDTGGYPRGVERINEPGIRNLRANRTLRAGMVITVEPGCYFNRSTLAAARANPTQCALLNWEKIDQFMDFGGVRIEDDVIVTETGIENMTLIGREIEDVEKYMASHPSAAAAA